MLLYDIKRLLLLVVEKTSVKLGGIRELYNWTEKKIEIKKLKYI